MKTETVKGFNDYSGSDAYKRTEIKRIIEETFQLYGFEPAETPIIELEEFVKGDNPQDEAVSDIFKLKDKGNRKLALRYEFTFQLKRLMKNKKLPYRRYQIGPVFRDEPVSANRFRQFTQCDADIIGSELRDDAEIIKLISEIMNSLGIKSEIFFNNRKLLNEILEEQKIKNKEEVMRIIDKLDKKSEKEIKQELKKFNAEKIIQIIKNKEKCKSYKTYNEIKEIKKYCKLFNVKATFLPSLARGLSYYNRTIFEVKSKKDKNSIAGGGSYTFNNIQSTGISFGLERLQKLAEMPIKSTKALVISINQDKRAIQLADKLRKNKISTIIMYNKITKALDTANSKNIPYTIIAGEKEKPKFKLKEMKSGKESIITESQIIKKLT